MINGTIVDRNRISPSIAAIGHSGSGISYTGLQGGAGMGYPLAFTDPGWQSQAYAGWPGAVGGWAQGASGIT